MVARQQKGPEGTSRSAWWLEACQDQHHQHHRQLLPPHLLTGLEPSRATHCRMYHHAWYMPVRRCGQRVQHAPFPHERACRIPPQPPLSNHPLLCHVLLSQTTPYCAMSSSPKTSPALNAPVASVCAGGQPAADPVLGRRRCRRSSRRGGGAHACKRVWA